MRRYLYKAALLFFIGLVLIFGTGIIAQAQLRAAPVKNVGDSITCYVGNEKYKLTPDKALIIAISAAPNNIETQGVFDKISEYTDLRRNIYLIPVEDNINVQICPGDVNYIAYNGKWLERIYDETKTPWALYAIIAHEIGHYVKAHDRTSLGSNPQIELEADEYAGEVLAKMGACLSDAQAAYRSKLMGANQESHTHPPINERLIAVKKGWDKFGKCPTPQVNLPQPTSAQVDFSQLSLRINIYGQLNTVYILPASTSATIGEFNISSQLKSHTYFLQKGTVAEVFLYGQSNKVYVSRELAKYIKFTQPGQLNEVIIK